jgi:DNA-binding NarL/FixJ family response regulator
MKLLVVDDSELIRSRLVGLIERIPGIQPVAIADSLHQALYEGSYFQPDLIVLDLNLPDGNAVRIIPLLKRMREGLRIAVLTNDANDYSRQRCAQAGADWFFDKSTELEQLLALLHEQAAATH